MTDREAIRRLADALAQAKVVIERHEVELAAQRVDLAKAIHYVDAMRKLFFKEQKQKTARTNPSGWSQWEMPEVYQNGPKEEA